MKITETFEYNKSIILDKSKIESINNLVLEYCKSTDIYIRTAGSSEIQFENINELFDFDNFNKNKITYLKIRGWHSSLVSINIFIRNDNDFSLRPYRGIFKCDYDFDSTDNKTIFLEKINNILEKSKSIYSIFGTIFLPIAMISVPLFIIGTSDLESISNPIIKKISTISFYFSLFGSLLLYGAHKKITYKLFPPIVFLLGEEIKCYERYSKVSWGIFVSLFVGLLGNIIWSILLLIKNIF